MPVPASISDLSTTPALNSPAGSESPALVDDYLRTHAAFIKQVSDSNDTTNVKLTGNQTIAGTKTFSSPIAGSVTGSAGSLSGTVAIANGGTGQTTAAAAFNALKQDATDAATGVVELATSAEAQAGTDTTRVITPSTLKSAQIQLGTAVASTSGTAIDFTGMPSWVKRITVLMSGISLSGTSLPLIQLGDAGGFETTGYVSGVAIARDATTTVGANSSAGFICGAGSAATNTFWVLLTLSKVSGNTWLGAVSVMQGASGAAASQGGSGSGAKTLSDTLTQVRITSVNGTDTFDAGTVNVSWE